jgi:hypothetical protein
MRRKLKSMPLEEHVETADDLAIAFHHLSRVFCRCQEYYPISGKLMKLLNKVCPGDPRGVLSEIQNELDNEHAKVIGGEKYQQEGPLYYRMDERYKRIQRPSS